MADEIMTEAEIAEQKANEAKPEAEASPATKEYSGVLTGKPEQVEALPPYHNAETAKIAEDRAKDVEDKPYEFVANGYTVKEVKGENGLPDTYVVTAEGFELSLPTKNAAEVYATTHSEAHKDLPVGFSKT
jgi:hypothetical protein